MNPYVRLDCMIHHVIIAGTQEEIKCEEDYEEIMEEVMEFRITSEETKRRLLKLFPSKIVTIQSVSADGRCLHLAL